MKVSEEHMVIWKETDVTYKCVFMKHNAIHYDLELTKSFSKRTCSTCFRQTNKQKNTTNNYENDLCYFFYNICHVFFY